MAEGLAGDGRGAGTVLFALVLAALAAGCGPAVSAPSVGVALPSPADTASTGPAARSPAAAVLTASSNGVRLEVALDRTTVTAGEEVRAHLALHNDRDVPLVFGEPCMVGALGVQVTVPSDPVGRDWAGVRRQFKDYALEHSQGSPMEWSIREPLFSSATPDPCHAETSDAPEAGFSKLPARATYENDFTWSADLVSGVPATDGTFPISAHVDIDPTGAGSGLVSFDTIATEGTITVEPGERPALSTGEVLDSAIADAKFADWLSVAPRKTWENANLFPMPAAHGVKALPEVPYWEVDLFREPRSFAILYIDALTGDVLRRVFCNVPCDR